MKIRHAIPLRLRSLFGIGGLLALFILLNWNSITAPFETDEGEYAYSAWIMKEGHVPYRDAFMQKPPMIIYTYLLAQFLGGDGVWPPHLLGALALALSTILLGVIAAREFGNSTGWISAWLFLPMMALPVLAPFAANTEKFMLLPMLGMLAVYVFNPSNQSTRPWFWSGVFCGTAMLYKPVLHFFSAFVYCVWAVTVWRNHRNGFALLKCLALAGLGIVVATAAVLAWFVYKGALNDLWECCVAYNFHMIEFFKTSSESLVFHMGAFIRAWFFSLALVLAIFLSPARRHWLYVALLLVSIFSVRNAHAGHYFIIVLPLFAMLAADGLRIVSEKFARSTGSSRIGFLSTAAVIAVALECWPIRNQPFLKPAELAGKVYQGYAFVESPIVAKRVGQLSNPDDLVFIGGSEPQILYYAQRKSPTRFVTMFPLMFPTPSALKYQRETIRDLEKRPPHLIVLAQYQWSWWQTPQSPTLILSHLSELLEKQYLLVGGFVRNGDGGEWHEPIDPRSVPRCSLLLYKRKT